MAEKCTKTSSPVERWINPYPFAPLNHFTVPFSLTKKLLSPLSLKYSSVSHLIVPGKRDTPSKDGKNSVANRVRARPHQYKRLPQFRHSIGSDETAWSRKRRRDNQTARHRTSTWTALSPTSHGWRSPR